MTLAEMSGLYAESAAAIRQRIAELRQSAREQDSEEESRALRRRFNPENFYLTGDGLAVFYPMYALAPASAGIPVFTVPYEAEGPVSPVKVPLPDEKTPPA